MINEQENCLKQSLLCAEAFLLYVSVYAMKIRDKTMSNKK